ncbi:MAG: choice-of-anchor L domain-containing protein [Bacteroidia bacterium]|nr:choice-of-anchor L domain-containing protein [Bacteroidia bacterium]
MKKIYMFFYLSVLFVMTVYSQPININTLVTASQFFTNYFKAGGITVTNVVTTYSSDQCYSFFSNVSSFDTLMSGGFLMTNGSATNASGPNDNSSTNTNVGTTGDVNLNTLTGQTTYDASVVQFDFVPKTNTIQFRFVFASDEYPTVYSAYNDVFACFLTGQNPVGGNYASQNIALVPGTSTYISVCTINPDTNAIYYHSNGNGTSPNNEAIEYDGFTTVLIATANVVPNQTYHMKLAIADGGDNTTDTGVFLEAGSFTDGYTGTASPMILTGDITSVSCNNGSNGGIDLNVTGGTPPFTYYWTYGATTQDVSGLPYGGRFVTVKDSLNYSETGVFFITQPTAISINSTVTDFQLSDCGNENIGLIVTGGTTPYSYLWNDGQNSVYASGLSPGVYSCTVTDSNSCTKTISISNYYLSKQPFHCFASQSSGSLDDQVSGIITDNSGNVYITGNYYSPALSFDTDTLINNGSRDIFLIKFNSAGNVIWARSYGSTGDDLSKAITIDNNDNIFICGHFNSSTITFDTITLTTNGNYDIFLAKISTNGNVIWAKRYGGAGADNCNNIACNNSGFVFITGNYSSTSVSFGSTVLSCSTPPNVFTAKFNTNGTIVWVKAGIGSGADYGNGIACDTNGNVFICGTFDGSTFSSDGMTLSDYGSDFRSGFIVKYDSNGATQWGNKITGSLYVYVNCNSITCDNNDNVWTVGEFTNELLMVQGAPYNLFSNGSYDVFMVKYSNSGSYLFTGGFGGNSGDYGKSVRFGSDGFLYITGQYVGYLYTSDQINYDNYISSGGGNSDVYVAKFYPSGNIAAMAHAGSSGTDVGSAVAIDNSGTVYTAGWFNSASISFDSCIVTNNGGYDIFVTKGQLSAYYLIPDVGNVTCTGDNNGWINLSVCGGKSPYTYNWSNGQTTQNLSNISAGTYYVSVTDANSFKVIDSITITAQYLFNVSYNSNGGCYGMSNGYIDLTVTNGTSPYSFLWSNNATTEDISNITPGTYNVTVSDANCVLSAAYIYDQSPQIVVTEDSLNVHCMGGSDGSAGVTVTGGTGSYSYLWSNGETNQIINNLIAGNYNFIITDNNNCTVSGSITVTQPDSALSLTFTQTNISCANGSDGSIDITVFGGTSPYNYHWSNGSTNQNISGLSVTNYTVTITDFNACNIVQAFNLIIPSGLIINVNQSNVTNSGGSDGSIDITVTGGISPYSYHWNNGQTTEDLNNLFAGWYYVTVTDSNGCIISSSVHITQPNSIDAVDINYYTLNVFPNPFNEITEISFYQPEKAKINLSIYDMIGDRTYELIKTLLPEGKHSISFDGSKLASGVYSLRLITPDGSISKMMYIIH